jgi:hypothetical protein
MCLKACRAALARARKNGEDLPQSKTIREQVAQVSFSARSWTAPALWRFYRRRRFSHRTNSF